jgi:hypothetical protein
LTDQQLTVKNLYALMSAEFAGRTSSPFVYDSLALQGAYWVMDLGHYKQVRAACQAAGAIYPPDEQDTETWVPKPEDRLFGLLVEVRGDGGPPHLEYP